MVPKDFGNLIVAMPRKDRRAVVDASARWAILLQAFRKLLSATSIDEFKGQASGFVAEMILLTLLMCKKSIQRIHLDHLSRCDVGSVWLASMYLR